MSTLFGYLPFVSQRTAGRVWVVGLILSSQLFISCHKNNEVDPVSSLKGQWTLKIMLHGQDGFFRQAPLTGATDLILVGKDINIQARIPEGDFTYAFTNLPAETYVVTANQAGYYPATLHPYSSSYGQFFGEAYLCPLPSEKMRIDSIALYINTIVPGVHLQLYCKEIVPVGGYRSAAVFAGLSPEVSPVYSKYVFAQSGLSQSVGSASIEADIYQGLRRAGIPSGVRAYLTARLATGATSSQEDPVTGLPIFSYLENNTSAVVSFIMP